MIGTVDNAGRAVVRVRLKHPTNGMEGVLDVWIDTGFTGELVIPKNQVTTLGLPLGPAVKAALADGSEVQLDTFTCLVEWFDETKRIEVIANDGYFPLLGIGLLKDRVLEIDYRNHVVKIG